MVIMSASLKAIVANKGVSSITMGKAWRKTLQLLCKCSVVNFYKGNLTSAGPSGYITQITAFLVKSANKCFQLDFLACYLLYKDYTLFCLSTLLKLMQIVKMPVSLNYNTCSD